MAARKKHNPNLGGELQMTFFEPESNWKPPQVSELPSWAGAKRIAIDCETKDSLLTKLGPGPRRGAYVTGWSFAIEGGPKHYLPMRHEGGGNLPVEEVLKYLRGNMKQYSGEYVGANLSYDIDFAETDNLVFHQDAKFRDIQIADPLIYELHHSFSLKNIGERWGVESKKEELLNEAAKAFGLDSKAGMWRLNSKYVGGYAENDATSPLEIYEKQRQIIEQDELWPVFNLETDVLPCLVRMRQRGVLIDQDKLAEIAAWALEQESLALKEIEHATGVRIDVGNVWKADALAPALVAIGFQPGRTPTGKPQIQAEKLEAIDHPVATAILRARKTNKLRTTFVASIERYMVNGRLHCTFNQIAREDEKGDQKGARYGRLSATDPNLQQQPSPERDPEIAGEWRKIFIPERGAIWGCNDYSQQEPRWTTHFAAAMDLPRAQEAAKRFRDDPTTDNHDMMTRLIHTDAQVEQWLLTDKFNYKVNRGYSKQIFLGLCYGEGGAKLCSDINLPTRWALFVGRGRGREIVYFEDKEDAMEERYNREDGVVREVAGLKGQEIIDGFDIEVPFVRRLAKAASDRANSVGYVKTVIGRRLHFAKRDDGSYDWTHKALNRVIQGTSADQTKKAIVEIDRAGYFLQLQVHDETNGSYENVEQAREVGVIMEECILDTVKPLVPFNVDTECGISYGELS